MPIFPLPHFLHNKMDFYCLIPTFLYSDSAHRLQRTSRLFPTRRAVEAVGKIRAAAARWQERVLEPVPQEERERFLSYLSAVSLRAAALCSDPQESGEPEDGGLLP